MAFSARTLRLNNKNIVNSIYMKNIMKYKLASIGLLFSLMATSFLSCSDDETYTFSGDSGKVYVRLQSSNMVNSVSNVVDAKIAKTPVGTFGDAVATFPIRSTMPVSGSLTATFSIDNSLVETYNAKHKTDYQKIDESLLVINGQNLTIEKGQMESAEMVEVKVDPAKMEALEIGDYLVPIKLMSATGSMTVSENWNTVYLHIAVANDPGAMPFADRTDWTIADCSSEEINGEDAPASNVLDGDWGSIWHTEWFYNAPNPPHYITIDMGKVCTFAGFQYVTRSSGAGVPQELTVAASLDNETWEDIAIYDSDDLPTGGSKEFKTLFNEFKEARYFRLTIMKNGRGAHYTCLAEVNAYVINK